MNHRHHSLCFALFLFGTQFLFPSSLPGACRPETPALAGVDRLDREAFAEEQPKKDDPGYKLYREGYQSILDEQWSLARERFARLITEKPTSEYIDDAEYWSAYALARTDAKQGAKAYRAFLKKHPTSRYYDDAASDLSRLAPAGFTTVIVDGKLLDPDNPSDWGDDKLFIEDKNGKGYVYRYGPAGHGPSAKVLERQLRAHARALKRVRLPGHPPIAPRPHTMEGDLDADTRLRLEALDAIGSSKQDSTSFRALREIAVDRSQHRVLRVAAMEQLVGFTRHDPLPVFIQIAREDTSAQIQTHAIESIGMVRRDKNRSVETLVDLFHAIPRQRAEQREEIFFAIAEVGNDRAVDFLARVARSHDGYELRSQAVFYLGSIGSERARKALYEILRSK